MSANIKRLKLRIRSVESTLHLTKAMQLVASGKIRRATEMLAASRSYSDAVKSVVTALSKSPECAASPYIAGHKAGESGEKTLLIVIAGDRGLAGGYNANAFRLADTVKPSEIIPIGKRSVDRILSGNHGKMSPISNGFPTEHFKPEDAKALAEGICKRYQSGQIDKVLIVSTRYISVLTQNAVLAQLLPLDKNASKEMFSNRGRDQKKNQIENAAPAEEHEIASAATMVFEPSPEAVLKVAIPEYLSSMIYGAVRESFASEVAARRYAMDSATKNGIVMKDNLSLEYNRARQGAITQEIVEIVAGAGEN